MESNFTKYEQGWLSQLTLGSCRKKYLEVGVEQDNIFSYNFAAHIHTIGPDILRGDGQQKNVYVQNESLTLPAGVTDAGFYMTSINNIIIGNAAVGVSHVIPIYTQFFLT